MIDPYGRQAGFLLEEGALPQQVDRALEKCGADLAAILVEPIVGNSGFIPPHSGFLEGLRSLADESGALLIFDEVMTGFRIAPGGARGRR